MRINDDFSRWASVTPREYRWVTSPQGGVERVMLDRIGGEQARATSIVRYAPDSFFPRHEHPAGEEILVLSGVFSEEGEHYPAGWYLRNPPGSGHCPSSREGALIFVKLRQMLPDERLSVRIDTRDPAAWQRREGVDVCPLFSNAVEHVSLRRAAPGATALAASKRGVELLVLAGAVVIGVQSYERGSWVRSPRGACPAVLAGAHGAMFYVKETEAAYHPSGAQP